MWNVKSSSPSLRECLCDIASKVCGSILRTDKDTICIDLIFMDAKERSKFESEAGRKFRQLSIASSLIDAQDKVEMVPLPTVRTFPVYIRDERSPPTSQTIDTSSTSNASPTKGGEFKPTLTEVKPPWCVPWVGRKTNAHNQCHFFPRNGWLPPDVMVLHMSDGRELRQDLSWELVRQDALNGCLMAATLHCFFDGVTTTTDGAKPSFCFSASLLPARAYTPAGGSSPSVQVFPVVLTPIFPSTVDPADQQEAEELLQANKEILHQTELEARKRIAYVLLNRNVFETKWQKPLSTSNHCSFLNADGTQWTRVERINRS